MTMKVTVTPYKRGVIALSPAETLERLAEFFNERHTVKRRVVDGKVVFVEVLSKESTDTIQFSLEEIA